MVGGERENEGSGSLRVWQCTACATNTRMSDDDDEEEEEDDDDNEEEEDADE